jgi:ABC-type nitrate/sulfonate/bicarbonate transport system permease component
MADVPFRGGGFIIADRPWASLGGLFLLIALWQTASMTGLLSPIFLPAPSSVAAALVELWTSGDAQRHVAASLVRIGGGWLLGTTLGLILGVAMGIFSLARAAGLPIVSALFPIPKIALLPLLILWFGIGEASQIATIALGVFFPTVVAGYAAVDAVPKNLVRMAQSFGAPPGAILRKVILPGAMPGILSGFRITASIALILVVSAEMIGARYGVGALVLTAGNLMQTDKLLAGVVMLSIMGLSVGFVLNRVERHLLRWR